MRSRSVLWIYWTLGFVAGFYLGAWLFLSVQFAAAQSPEVAAAIREASATYGVSEGWLRRVAWCESRYTPGATSRGGHQGLYQYAAGTWRWLSAQAGYAGASPYDPWAAAMVTGYAFAHGYAHHWSCR